MTGKFYRLALAMVLCGALPAAGSAQGQRNVELVVPFPAGGVTDLTARSLAEDLSKQLGQTVIVLNKDGAAGTIGAAAIAASPADGFTIGYTAMGSITGQPHLRKDLRYNVGSFDYICQVTTIVTAILVPNDSPFRSLQQLFEQAKQSPDKLTYGHPGPGSIPHLQMLDLSSRAGVTLTSVPFRGEAPARNALMGKHIDMIMSGDSGSISSFRALAVVAGERMTGLPDVPSTQELGFGEGFPTPFGIFAPKGLAPEMLDRLRKACAEAVKSPNFVAAMTKSGQTIQYLDGPAFAARMAQVSRDIGNLVERVPSLKN